MRKKKNGMRNITEKMNVEFDVKKRVKWYKKENIIE